MLQISILLAEVLKTTVFKVIYSLIPLQCYFMNQWYSIAHDVVILFGHNILLLQHTFYESDLKKNSSESFQSFIGLLQKNYFVSEL